MSTPYQLLGADARTEIVRRKSFYERKLQQCEEFLRTLDALPSFFNDPLVPREGSEPLSRILPAASTQPGTVDAVEPRPAFTQHRRKESLYDEEMRRLLTRVKVVSKMIVFQHFHVALRGNTSIGAVESYLKRAALRGVIVRKARGEYTLPPQTA